MSFYPGRVVGGERKRVWIALEMDGGKHISHSFFASLLSTSVGKAEEECIESNSEITAENEKQGFK